MNGMGMAVAGVLAAIGLTSCGSSDVAVDYDEQTRSGFMAACADSVSDSQLVGDVCECVYAKVEDTIAYSELIALQTTVDDTDDPEDQDLPAPLPEEIEEIVAVCVSGEATLDG